MNKSLIKQRFSRSLYTYSEHAVVQKNVAYRLAYLVEKYVGNNFDSVMEIGCGSGFLTRRILQQFNVEKYYLNDISEKCLEILVDEGEQIISDIIALPGDAELIDFPIKLDLIISSSTIQWFEDVETFFHKANKFLGDNSYFIFSTYSSENFSEILKLTGIGITYPDVETILKNQNNFEILHVENNAETLFFNQPCDVLKHMKQTGVNGLFQTAWTPSVLRNFTNNYSCFFISGKGYPLTYCPQYFVLKKR